MVKISILPHSHSFASNTYLVESGNECVIVDPAAPVPDGFNKKLKYIFLTHAHFDHMLDIDEWVAKTGAEVIVSAYDRKALADSELNCYMLLTNQDKGYTGPATAVTEGEELSFGCDQVKIISTPGHTPGSMSLLIGSSLFVGDTIFAGGGYGKCCFPGGDFGEIRKSIVKILWLDDSVIVYPGHGESTTIKEYKNDFLR